MDIYVIYRSLAYKKGITCGQDAVINDSIRLGVPISQDIIYQKYHPKIKVDTSFINTIHSPYVSSTLKFDNVIFDIVTYGKIYNLPQVEMVVYT